MNTLKVNGLRLLSLLCAVSFLAAGSANATERTTTVQWGPIHIPAMGESEAIAGVSGFASLLVGLYSEIHSYPVTKPCGDCYITDIVPNIVTADGTTGNYSPNGIMLHHVVNFNWSHSDVTCRPNIFSGQTIKRLGGVMGGNERFFASGNERTENILPDGYGYYIGSGDDWGLAYHVMNMGMQDQDVYFEFTFKWEPASEFNGYAVRPIWIDIDQCNDSTLPTSAGYNDLHWSWQSDRTHVMAGIGGHVHDYGINTAWHNASTGQTACNSVAGYAAGSPYAPVGPGTGADSAHNVYSNVVTSDPLGLANYNGHISDMTVCAGGANGAYIHKGDQMAVHTQYYRPDSATGDMGILVGYMDEAYCITTYWCY